MRRSSVCTVLSTIALLLGTQSASAIVTVGPVGSGCTYSKIQEAINYVIGKERSHPDDVDPYIAVAGDNFYNEALVIDSSNVTGYVDPFGQTGAFVQIYGNYNQSCGDIPNGSTATVGAGGGKSGNSVLEVKGSEPIHVVLNHLNMVDASGVTSGGGINFHASAAGYLDLSNVDISGNHARFGAGVYANGHAPGLTLALHDGTRVEGNTASEDGGGILVNGETFFYASEGGTSFINNIAGGAGGGIAFAGHGSMVLGGAQILVNEAAEGGGLYVYADSPTDVTFGDSVFIEANKATQDGGGITLAGKAKLSALSTTGPTQIILNQVSSDTGPGGGVYVAGPAEMRFTGTISSNSAGYGGGIAAIAGGDLLMDAYVALTPAGPTTPVDVSNNSATHSGGGIFVKANSTFSTNGDDYIYATVCATDFRINANTAVEGTAIYADEGSGGILAGDFGSTVALNFDGIITGRLGCPHPAFQCAPGIACNEVNGNYRTGAGSGFGSTILIQDLSTLEARRVKMQFNEGAHALRSVDDQYGMNLDTLLITDNTVDGELIHLDSADLKIVDSTIAHNTIGAAYVIRSAGNITMSGTIIAEATTNTIDFAGNNGPSGHNFDFVQTNPSDPTLPATGFVLYSLPVFVDFAQHDYHLRPYSPGLDVAPAGASASFDLDGARRDLDLPQIQNVQGPRDLGAYERQSIPRCSAPDVLFCSTFEP